MAQSQSGNFLRAAHCISASRRTNRSRKVYDGAWPIIAGKRISLNVRFALPDGAQKLYESGGEGPQWWSDWPDPVRGLPAKGILDRCTASKTCPKIIEHYGSAEAWALNLSPALVGTSADKDIPLPANVRRYYIPSTAHGGGQRRLQRDRRQRRPCARVRTSAPAFSPAIPFRTPRR